MLKLDSMASRVIMLFRHHSKRPSSLTPSLMVLNRTSLMNRVIVFLYRLPLIPSRGDLTTMLEALQRDDLGLLTISASRIFRGRKEDIPVFFPILEIKLLRPYSFERVWSTIAFSPVFVVAIRISGMFSLISYCF